MVFSEGTLFLLLVEKARECTNRLSLCNATGLLREEKKALVVGPDSLVQGVVVVSHCVCSTVLVCVLAMDGLLCCSLVLV